MAMRIVRYLDSNDPVFQNGFLARDRRYERSIHSDAMEIEIHESTLSEDERTSAILKNVRSEINDIEWMNEHWGAGTWCDLDPHDLVKKTTATFDIDFSQDPSTTDDTKRVFAKIINAHYPTPSSSEETVKS